MLTLTGSCPLSEFAAKERETRCCRGSRQKKQTKRERSERENGGEQSVDLEANERRDQKSFLLVQRLSEGQITLDRKN